MDNHLLEITPTELVFLPPYNKQLTNVLRLRNLSENAITFKLKTTAPKKYAVKPMFDYILPKETKKVHVTLYAQKDNPTSDTSDSFQILCFPIEGHISQPFDLKSLWDGTVQTHLSRYKIRSRFSQNPSQESEHNMDMFASTFSSDQTEDLMTSTTNSEIATPSANLRRERDDLKNKILEEQRRSSSLTADLRRV
eukprot:TRINITY_DN575_c0_g2_i1.p1 TRINITY_DN575_c0_g2~~TRINITY_DN575_c0_g2_i1.p1  ORF type:complete len:195 (+),score=37.69 TRINITY_DN575_c0_g2_i1:100-684(+)